MKKYIVLRGVIYQKFACSKCGKKFDNPFWAENCYDLHTGKYQKELENLQKRMEKLQNKMKKL